VAIVWLAVIAWSTLRSAPEQAATVAALPWYCLACGNSGATDVILNLLLFLPLGLAARALNWPLRRTAASLLALTLLIEVTQGTLLVGRDASLSDVLTNTIGGTIGWLAYPLLRRLGQPSQALARRGTALVLALGIAVWSATAAALRPALSGAAPWTVQRTPHLPYHDRFPGRLLRAVLNGAELPEGTLHEVVVGRDSLDLSIDLIRTGELMLPRTAPLLRVVAANQEPQANVTERYGDAVVEFAVQGGTWRLRTPQWQFRNAFRIPGDSSWRLRWRWSGNQLQLTSGSMADSAPGQTALRLSIAEGWIFIHPYVGAIGASEPLWTALWIGWWFGVLGWLAGWCLIIERWLFGLVAIAALIALGVATGLPVSLLQAGTAGASYVALLAFAIARRNAGGLPVHD
jgi:hypothetical protein